MEGNNILGIGTDLIEVERIHHAMVEHPEKFLASLFTEKEVAYFKTFAKPHPHIAGHFAAKEAIAKALGCGFGKHLSWHDLEISHDELGKPLVKCLAKIGHGKKILVTISHTSVYAVAFAIMI